MEYKRPKSNLRKLGNRFEMIQIAGRGTFGCVYKAFKPKNPKKFYALKKISLQKEIGDGFPFTSIREIKLLKELKHQNIVFQQGSAQNNYIPSTFMVLEYMEHDLWALWKNNNFEIHHIKNLLIQLLQGINYLHEKKIIHRDLKAANLLINNKGILKVADFGLGRWIDKVVTFPYRAPELMLGQTKYNEKIDMWSIGCIFGEWLIKKVMFARQKEKDQMEYIYQILGEPQERWPQIKDLKHWKHLKPTKRYTSTLQSFMKSFRKDISDTCIDLLEQLLDFNPETRISAQDALNHQFFEEQPLPCSNQKLIQDLVKKGEEYHVESLKNKKKKQQRINNYQQAQDRYYRDDYRYDERRSKQYNRNQYGYENQKQEPRQIYQDNGKFKDSKLLNKHDQPQRGYHEYNISNNRPKIKLNQLFSTPYFVACKNQHFRVAFK